jgi:hypothetical protein
MNVTKWKTPATFFPWPHVQAFIDRIDAQVYHVAVEMAQQFLGDGAKPCPGCGCPPKELFWFSITSPEADWHTGTGRVGFLTLCKACKVQVDFLVDQELTQMQVEQWRDYRALY